MRPATRKETRLIEHARRMQAKRARSPSFVLVRNTLAQWRTSRGYGAAAPIYPEGWDCLDLTSQVLMCRNVLIPALQGEPAEATTAPDTTDTEF